MRCSCFVVLRMCCAHMYSCRLRFTYMPCLHAVCVSFMFHLSFTYVSLVWYSCFTIVPIIKFICVVSKAVSFPLFPLVLVYACVMICLCFIGVSHMLHTCIAYARVFLCVGMWFIPGIKRNNTKQWFKKDPERISWIKMPPADRWKAWKHERQREEPTEA